MSEALRLAAVLEDEKMHSMAIDTEAAAELRRLHAENERLRQINQSHEMKLSVRGYEIQIDDLKALNAELVEALRSVVAWMDAPDESAFSDTQLAAARAALAKVEASK